MDFDNNNITARHRFGANLIIEEEKVEFPKGKGNIKRYDVRNTLPLSTAADFPSLACTDVQQDPETLSGTPVQRYFKRHSVLGEIQLRASNRKRTGTSAKHAESR